MRKALSKYLAEFIATGILVFCGTGAVTVNEITGGTVGHMGIALTFGAIVMAMIYSFGETSGAHINPAVTLAFWISGQFPAKQIAPYILSQCAGAIAGSSLLRVIFPEANSLGETLPAGTVEQSFILEVVLTFILMLVIIQVATGAKEQGVMAGIAIGLVVLLEAAFAGPISGASMNPARSLGPALINGNLEHLWIYLTAPFIGASLGILPWFLTKHPHEAQA